MSLGLLCLCVVATSCAKPQGETVAEQRNAVKQMRQEVLSELYAVHPEMRTRLQQVPGYGVFSNRSSGLLIFGTGNGYGVVMDNTTGRETIMRMAQVGVGLGVGLKDYRAVFVFKNRQVLQDFVEYGWDFGGHADAAAKSSTQGAATGAEVSAQEAIEIYQFTEAGIALRAEVAGTKYWKDPDLN
jgi:lipid-binding SYLF domain-containing protein